MRTETELRIDLDLNYMLCALVVVYTEPVKEAAVFSQGKRRATESNLGGLC